MARKSRIGIDPLMKPLGKKPAGAAAQTDGINALIRDTRETPEPMPSKKAKASSRSKAKPKAKLKAAKKPGAKAMTAIKKKTAPATSKKALAKKAPIKPVKKDKKPVLKKAEAKAGKTGSAPRGEPGAVIDLAASIGTPTAPAVPVEIKEPVAPEPEAMHVQQKQPIKVTEDKEDDYFDKAKATDSSSLYMSYDDQDDTDQFLEFSLGQEHFAFEIGSVREVLTYTKVTNVPQTPDYMAGVINLRGNVVPVVDLRLLFGLEKCEDTVDTCIVIVEVEFEDEVIEIGAIADAVREVFDLKDEDIEPAPKIGTHLDTSFIKGMGRKGDEFTLILDLKEVFSAANLWED